MATRRWLIDLDGVVWRMEVPIPGAAEAIAALRQAGVAAAFFTNNSWPRHEDLLARLHRIGIAAEPEELLSSPQAAAQLCNAGERALVIGGEGVFEALAARGVLATPVSEAPADLHADVVVVGIDPAFNYAALARAASAIEAGARFIATNDDATFPLPDRTVPGAGALVAAIATASGTAPEIAGKPYPASARLAKERFGEVELVVGDRISTDGALADVLGVPFALVLSGVTKGAGPFAPPPAHVEADLATLVERLVGARTPTSPE